MIGVIQALNEIDYLEASIRSLQGLCEPIIVFEATSHFVHDYLLGEGLITPDGLSTDGTTELLERKAGQGEIVYHPIGNFVGTVEWILLKIALDYTPVGEYFCWLTGNEVLLPQTQERIRQAIQLEHPVTVGLEPVTLWKTPQWRIYGRGWSNLYLWKVMYHRRDSAILDEKRSLHLGPAHHGDPFVGLDRAYLKLPFVRDPERVYHKIAWQEIYFGERLDHLGPYRSLRDYVTRTSHWFTEIHDEGVSVVPCPVEIPAWVPVPDDLVEYDPEEQGWD